MKLNTILLAGAAMFVAHVADAQSFTNASSGIANSTATITFDGQTDGADLTNAYAAQGVTFSGLQASTGFGNASSPANAPSAVNFNPSQSVRNDPFSISFAKPVSDFFTFLVTDGGGTTISAYLGEVLVGSFAVGAYNKASSYQGFTNTDIDRVTFNVGGDQLALIDNVSYKTAAGAVPEPATWAMMLLGFGMIGFGMRYRRKGTKVSFA